MHSRVLAASLFMVVAAALGACTSDDEPASPTTRATTESSSTPSATDATKGTPGVSASAAGGEQVQLKNTVKFRVPAEYDWLIDDSGDSILATAVIDGGVLDISSHDVLWDSGSLEEAADITLDTWNEDTSATYRRTANRTVAGVEGFVIGGKRNQTLLLEFGTLHNGRLVTLDLNHPETFDPATAVEIFDAVLASVEWK
ncbi:hypothetical protein [Nocardioides sp. WS12]|uniref:hypothetical protein n=1 Tax=Nocardioides sp. WS12 TaxID=2486272 RepID=UPI0015FE1032|nr:hypothetical protein [Nocardioides sp. WS12]